MQIKLPQASLAGPSQRSSAAKPLIANIFQGTDLVHRHCDSPLDGPRATPAIPHAYRLRPLSDLTQDPAGIQYTYATLWVAVLSNPFLAHRRGDHPSDAFPASRAATLT